MDLALFQFINSLPHTDFSDSVALFLSGVGSFGAIWIIIAFFVMLKEESEDKGFYKPMLGAVFFSFLLVEYVLKPLFGRVRPEVLPLTILVQSPIGGFSFPSGHAATAFAGAAVLSRFTVKSRILWYVLAFFVSMSRIYLGKHYPSDVLAGGVIGFFVGKLAVYFYDQTQRKRASYLAGGRDGSKKPAKKRHYDHRR